MQKTIEQAKGKLRGQSSGFIVSNQQRQCRRQKEWDALQQQHQHQHQH